ncbi:hypothetical protein [Natranaerobius thermophilus]|uniref:Uncharacterized protein n=1 Tax=Natranaerobius thermophilus (strain ATCC BAA-1301 / DSM 18059 / JW/NM-WN-LF) TaxID=457570 RepID=B2A7T3_NATTJ|nr:hypothetical protein [Natranaerobius thermophilus]ACB84385.1 hypothetical protein Nther_0798 [Natranaerobius thermophilus JW/NM-WN-LF]
MPEVNIKDRYIKILLIVLEEYFYYWAKCDDEIFLEIEATDKIGILEEIIEEIERQIKFNTRDIDFEKYGDFNNRVNTFLNVKVGVSINSWTHHG